MRHPKLTIPYNVYRPIYDRLVQKNKHIEFANVYKKTYVNYYFNKEFISELMYNRLLSFEKKIDNPDFKLNGVRCKVQDRLYYDNLKSLIDSDDFQLYSVHEKNKVIEEQKRMYDRVNSEM